MITEAEHAELIDLLAIALGITRPLSDLHDRPGTR